MNLPLNYPEFFTATILQWKPLLKQDKYKEIVMASLAYLVKQNKLELFAFVIMSNHLHIIWRISNDCDKAKVQQSFMKYTAQQMLLDLRKHHKQVLEHFYVGAKDRLYQIWERNALSIEIHSNETMLQKMNYVHNNPVKAGLCSSPGDYKYSSAGMYEGTSSGWDFVKLWEL